MVGMLSNGGLEMKMKMLNCNQSIVVLHSESLSLGLLCPHFKMNSYLTAQLRLLVE